MSGSITKTQNGKWMFYFRAGKDQGTGKRTEVRRRGFATKKNANVAMVKMQQELDKGLIIGADKITVTEWLDHFIEHKTDITSNTLRSYKQQMERIKPIFGAILLKDLRKNHVKKLLNISHT